MRLAALLLVGAVACAPNSLTGGNYVLSLAPSGLAQDNCHIFDGGLWSGDLAISGYTLYMAYSLDSTELEGTYNAEEMNTPDTFEIDGATMGTIAVVHGEDGGVHQCAATYLNIDIQGTVTSDTSFVGVLSLNYPLDPNQTDVAGCVTSIPSTCVLQAPFTATLAP